MRPLPPSLPRLLRRYLLDRLGGVLDDIGDCLGDQPPVELGAERILLELGLDIDLGMGDLHQEHCLPHRVDDVLAFHHGLGHPGKARELVDHAPDVVDLAHDGVGALLEDLLVLGLGDVLAELAADAFGRELDRRQRVLDLVGDAARDVAPGRGALRRDQLGDVVERDDVAVMRLVLLRADADRKIALGAVAGDRDLALHQPLGPFPRRLHHLVEARAARRRADGLASRIRHARSVSRRSGSGCRRCRRYRRR